MRFSPDDQITQKEAAKIRGVSPQAINFLVKQGRFRTIKIGERSFLLRSEVEKYEPGKPGPPKRRDAKASPNRKIRKASEKRRR